MAIYTFKSFHIISGIGIAASIVLGGLAANATVITFDNLIQGQTSYSFDADNDGIPDITFTTTDPQGFNTTGPGTNQQYIQEPGLEGTTLFPTDLRATFHFGAKGPLSFGVAMSVFGSHTNAGSVSIYDSLNQLIETVTYDINSNTPNNPDFGDLAIQPNLIIQPSGFSEALVTTSNFSGTAAYADFDFMTGSRYIIDNFTAEFGSTEIPGGSFDNPLLPLPVSPGGPFVFPPISVTNPDSFIFIDPEISIGYIYNVADPSGPLFDGFNPPDLPFNDSYQLFSAGPNTCSQNASDFLTSLGTVAQLTNFNFSTPLACFAVKGIDERNGLDPANTLAFNAGVSFDKTGVVNVTQTPINVPGPLPVLGAAAAYGWARRLRRRLSNQCVPWDGHNTLTAVD